jgi:hypothetical protein
VAPATPAQNKLGYVEIPEPKPTDGQLAKAPAAADAEKRKALAESAEEAKKAGEGGQAGQAGLRQKNAAPLRRITLWFADQPMAAPAKAAENKK